MTTVKHSIAEHDVVSFRGPGGKWPAGTKGTVVSDYGDVKLVEISDDRGVTLDYVQMPAGKLEIVFKHGV